ncbi:MAG: hypothetical protein NTW19_21615 [Planctomycetota bacterium]|nr:hypothetical protein [Planctomycetota bacterium]
MSIQLSRAELWLLDVAVHYAIFMRGLMNGEVAAHINHSDHGCSADQIVNGLLRLFDEGLIVQSPFKARRRLPLPTRGEIEAELFQRPLPEGVAIETSNTLYYRLTPAGGAAWESFMHPQWDGYIEGARTVTGSNNPPCLARGCVTGTDRGRIETYLNQAPQIGHYVKRETVRWECVSPWRATYWKTFPLAHRAGFKMIYHDVYAENGGWPLGALELHTYLDYWRRW